MLNIGERKMKMNQITLRKEDNSILSFSPLSIDKIKIYTDKIILWMYKGKSLNSPKKTILYKKDYYYAHWDYFIKELRTFFDLI